uniref:Uncharacterized protein n=1 Tax=Mycena chlorophos TaxID=658473 RepID=A0ABQ0LY66_MYCCL|nr:predicted protein [Mycena chlorophos]
MSPYTPNEPPEVLEYERTFVAGDVIAGTGYGAQLVLYIICARGGPWTFFLNSQTLAVNVMFDSMYFLLTFLSDLIVLWRCYVIWSASGSRLVALAVSLFPGMLIFSTFGLGSAWTFYSTQPASSFYSELPRHVGTAYFAISLGSNIIMTILIAGRLVSYRRNVIQMALPEDMTQQYISLATITIESAAIYSVFALISLITYAINDPTNQIWLAVASSFQQISNLLIIYRLAEGSAWQQDTLNSARSRNTTIHFKTSGGAETDDGTLGVRLEPIGSMKESRELRDHKQESEITEVQV